MNDVSPLYINVNAINNIEIEVEWKKNCKGII